MQEGGGLMSKRKGLSKKVRFEVFKRDSFTCQYCGGKSPENILHVDHIEPVSKGGTDDLLNLVTACEGCNLGKGDRRLNSATATEKQHAQLAALQMKREQLEMMLEWQKSLINLDRDQVDALESLWAEICGIGWNDYARGEARKWVKKFPVDDVMSAIREATGSKLCFGEDGANVDSITEAFHLVPRILHLKRQVEKEPNLRDALYIRGILRRRFPNDDIDWEAKNLILEALRLTNDAEREKEIAKSASSYWSWECEIRRSINELQEEAGEQ